LEIVGKVSAQKRAPIVSEKNSPVQRNKREQERNDPISTGWKISGRKRKMTKEDRKIHRRSLERGNFETR